MNRIDVARVHGNAQLSQLTPRLKCHRCRRNEAKLTVLGPVYSD
jgi:hypothetical protein